MLSISNAKHAGGAISYFSDHLVQENASNPNEDYYASGEAGTWLGTGAKALGFDGEVTAEDFGKALLAIDENGEALVQNGGDSNRRAGWDLTFSAPKSVSTLWATGGDELNTAIEQAHSTAVDKAMGYLQRDGGIAGRRGKGGLELENCKLVAAKFNHGTSREQDPQLHTHTFVMNLAQRADGSWGAIQSYEVMKRKMTAGAVYRAHLANEMQKLGFGIDQKDKGLFEVLDVDENLQKHWSKRRKQVKEAMASHGGISAKSAEAAALSTRSHKEEVDQNELTDGWKQQATSFGVTPESIAELQDKEYEAIKMPSVDEIWQELTQQESTINEHKLKAKIFEKAAGALSINDAEQFTHDFIKSDKTIILRDAAGQKRYTSKEMYELEQSLVSDAKQRQSEFHSLSNDSVNKALAQAPTISDEQRKMIEHVTKNDGVSIVEGMAGTGKSFALAVANDAWKSDGYNVIGAALSGKAAEGLQDGASIKSQTLHSLLFELNPNPEAGLPAKRQLKSNDVLIIDEAGMVGSRQMADLLSKAAEAQAKVVLVGDSKQLQPIDAGGAFRSLSKALGAAELSDIRRQREGWHRDAVTALSEGDAGKALATFDKRGLFLTGNNHEDTIDKMVDKWLTDAKQANDNELKDSLMLAGTRADVAALNATARESIKDRLNGEIVTVNSKEYQSGDRLVFMKNNKNMGVKNGTLGTVVYANAEANFITVKLDSSEQQLVNVKLGEYDDIQHGYAMTVHKSQGMTTERAYVLANEYMSGQEWSYVATSRSKGETTIFADESLVNELDQVMSKETSKMTATEFELD